MYTEEQLTKITTTYRKMTPTELAEEGLHQRSLLASEASTEDDRERAEARLNIIEELGKRSQYVEALGLMKAERLVNELEKLALQAATLPLTHPQWYSSHEQLGMIRTELLSRLNECPGCGEQITGGDTGLCAGCSIG